MQAAYPKQQESLSLVATGHSGAQTHILRLIISSDNSSLLPNPFPSLTQNTTAMTDRFSQLKGMAGRAKQQARERVDRMRAKKRNYTLKPEEQAVEDEVECMKESAGILLKSLATSHPPSESKVQQHVLGNKLMSMAGEYTHTPYGAFFQKFGRVQLELGQLQAMHHSAVHERVVRPTNRVVDTVGPPTASARKTLISTQGDYDAAKNRFATACAKVHKQGYRENAAKVEAERDNMEEHLGVMQKAASHYVERLCDAAGQNTELGEALLELIDDQMQYHRSCLTVLERTLPSLKALNTAAEHVARFHAPIAAEGGVDPVLAQLAACINRDGLESEGIFRLAGSKSKVRRLQTDINIGALDLSQPAGYYFDINAVAGALKLRLRELEEPLLGSAGYADWMAAVRTQDHDERLYAIKELLKSLPPGQFATARFLARFLAGITRYTEVNKMAASNLAIVFGPNLTWPVSRESDPSYLTADSAPQGALCEALITYNEWLFDTDENGELDANINKPEDVPGAIIPLKRASRVVSMAGMQAFSGSSDSLSTAGIDTDGTGSATYVNTDKSGAGLLSPAAAAAAALELATTPAASPLPLRASPVKTAPAAAATGPVLAPAPVPAPKPSSSSMARPPKPTPPSSTAKPKSKLAPVPPPVSAKPSAVASGAAGIAATKPKPAPVPPPKTAASLQGTTTQSATAAAASDKPLVAPPRRKKTAMLPPKAGP